MHESGIGDRMARKKVLGNSVSTQMVIVFCIGIIVGWLGATSLFYQRRIGCSINGASLQTAERAMPTLPLKNNNPFRTNLSNDGWHSIEIFVGVDEDEVIDPGPTEWVAQARQDEAVFTLLRNKSNGFFVDLAANDAILLSNTYSLERYQGWKGICIEPNDYYWRNLTHFRRTCRIVGAVVGSQRNQPVHFYFAAREHGGIAGSGFDNGPKFMKHSRRAYTVTLHEILQRYRASIDAYSEAKKFTIDYLSLDVEGAEALVLEGFPLNEYHVHLLTVERPKVALRTLLHAHGFEQLQRLSRWGETLWAHKDFRVHLDLSRLEEFSGKKQHLAEKARKDRELS